MASLFRLIAVACLSVTLLRERTGRWQPTRGSVAKSTIDSLSFGSVFQLWNKNGGPGTYPAQVLTDVVNGEVVGLTAVYDKSVSVEELRSAIDKLYPNAAIHGLSDLWRVESDQLVIRLFDRKDGTKLLIYLKIVRGADSLVPSAHITNPSN